MELAAADLGLRLREKAERYFREVILNKLNLPETQMYNFILARPKQYYRKQLSFH
jgi:hypothetical protein